MQIVNGNLLDMAEEGFFDVIVHGVNCFCKQKSGIAKQMVERYLTNEFPKEYYTNSGDYNKLGTIDYKFAFEESNYKTGVFNMIPMFRRGFVIVNAYTQFDYQRDTHPKDTVYLNYNALRMCLDKINFKFKGKRIGLPKIGCGKAKGDWNTVKFLIETQLKDCDVTIVNYKEK